MKPAHLILLITLSSLYSLPLSSQNNHTHSDGHAHDSHNYHFGAGIAASKILEENMWGPGFHLHLIRQFGHHNQWGLGLGYEAIAATHWHHGLSLPFNYRPARFLSLLAGPGIAIANHEGETEIFPAFHTEAVFEFNVRGVHIGPMIGYGLDTEDSHFSVGIHLGLGF
jgi:hypothetical protein